MGKEIKIGKGDVEDTGAGECVNRKGKKIRKKGLENK